MLYNPIGGEGAHEQSEQIALHDRTRTCMRAFPELRNLLDVGQLRELYHAVAESLRYDFGILPTQELKPQELRNHIRLDISQSTVWVLAKHGQFEYEIFRANRIVAGKRLLSDGDLGIGPEAASLLIQGLKGVAEVGVSLVRNIEFSDQREITRHLIQMSATELDWLPEIPRAFYHLAAIAPVYKISPSESRRGLLMLAMLQSHFLCGDAGLGVAPLAESLELLAQGKPLSEEEWKTEFSTDSLRKDHDAFQQAVIRAAVSKMLQRGNPPLLSTEISSEEIERTSTPAEQAQLLSKVNGPLDSASILELLTVQAGRGMSLSQWTDITGAVAPNDDREQYSRLQESYKRFKFRGDFPRAYKTQELEAALVALHYDQSGMIRPVDVVKGLQQFTFDFLARAEQKRFWDRDFINVGQEIGYLYEQASNYLSSETEDLQGSLPDDEQGAVKKNIRAFIENIVRASRTREALLLVQSVDAFFADKACCAACGIKNEAQESSTQKIRSADQVDWMIIEEVVSGTPPALETRREYLNQTFSIVPKTADLVESDPLHEMFNQRYTPQTPRLENIALPKEFSWQIPLVSGFCEYASDVLIALEHEEALILLSHIENIIREDHSASLSGPNVTASWLRDHFFLQGFSEKSTALLSSIFYASAQEKKGYEEINATFEELKLYLVAQLSNLERQSYAQSFHQQKETAVMSDLANTLAYMASCNQINLSRLRREEIALKSLS